MGSSRHSSRSGNALSFQLSPSRGADIPEEDTWDDIGSPQRWLNQDDSLDSTVSSVRDAELAEAPAVLLITTVDIGDGQSDQIEVREGEDTLEVARAFCQQHGLPSEVVEPLAEHLRDNLAKVSGGRASASHPKRKASVSRRQKSTVRQSAPSQPLAAEHRRWTGGPSRKLYRSNDSSGAAAALSQSVQSDTGVRPSPPRRGSKGSPRGPSVHDRLYALAEERSRRREERAAQFYAEMQAELESKRGAIGWVSRELAASRDAGDYLNYGERLYVEGVVEREKKLQAAEGRKLEELHEELQGATFRPEITSAAQSVQRPPDMSRWERLSRGYSNQKQMIQTRIQVQRQEDAAKQVTECTFRPEINKRSERMMRERTDVLREHRITAHEQLFQDAIRRQLRQDEYSSWFPEDVTFQPATNPPDSWKRASAAAGRSSARLGTSSRRSAGTRSADSSIDIAAWGDADPAALRTGASASGRPRQVSAPESVHSSRETPAFAERLYAYRDKQGKRAAARAAASEPTFKPKTGRAPAAGRDLNGLTIGEYLYSKHSEIVGKKKYLSEQQERDAQLQRTKSRVSEQSEVIMERLRRRRFNQIFRFLDSSNEGVIDLVGIVLSFPEYLEHLDTEVRADVVEAANLLQARRDAFAKRCEEDESMSAEEIPEVLLVDVEGFSALMEEVLASNRGYPRSYLQPPPVSSRMEYPEYNHKPNMDPKSKALAAKRRPENIPAYEAMLHEWEQSRHKREVERAAREEAELSQCTFEPHLISEPLVAHGRVLRDSLATGSYQSLLRQGAAPSEEQASDGHAAVDGAQGRRDSGAAKSTAAASLMELAAMGTCGSDPMEDQVLKQLGLPTSGEVGKSTPVWADGHQGNSRPSHATEMKQAPKWQLEEVVGSDDEDDVHDTKHSIRGWTPRLDLDKAEEGAVSLALRRLQLRSINDTAA